MQTEKEARGALAGHWTDAMGAGAIGILARLLLLLLAWWGDRTVAGAFRDPFTQPFRMLLTLAIAFLDLLLLSPLRAGQAALYRGWQNGEDGRVWHLFSAFRSAEYGKCMALRLQIWWRGVWRCAAAFVPAACLLALSDRLCKGGLPVASEQVAYLLLTVAAWIFLAVGLLAVWLWWLRYMPAWYLLDDVRTASEAMRLSRRMMRGHVGEAAWLYVRFAAVALTWVLIVPYFYTAPRFYALRAAFVEERRRAFVQSDVYFAAQRKNC